MEFLDCTIRDGGYYNNWDFSKDHVYAYMRAMEKLPVNSIEVGYRNKSISSYEGKYFFCPDFVLKELKQWAPTKSLAVMLNEKDTSIHDLNFLLDPCKGYIEIVRLAIAPNRFLQGLELAKAIKEKGFKVAFNLMYMSTLIDNAEVLNQVSQLDGIVDYFNLVDSYGGVYPEDVKKLVLLCKAKTKAKIGFHGHNNIELAFANSLAAMQAGADTLDGTICGMGRGAGNLKTELFLTHMASKRNWNVDFDALSSIVSIWEELQKQFQWGTNLPYMVSGANSLPQKEVMDWVSKRFYSINSIIRALHNQSEGKEDNLKLPLFENKESNYKSAVIIGGGPSAVEHAEAITQFVNSSKDTCIIHASSKNAMAFQLCNWPQYFCLVGNEGYRLESIFDDIKHLEVVCVLPPYPRKMGTYIPISLRDKAFEFSIVDVVDKFKDSHTALALQLAKNLNVQNVYLAGYDGYANQLISEKEKELFNENNYLFDKAASFFKVFASITPNKYSIANSVSVYNYIS